MPCPAKHNIDATRIVPHLWQGAKPPEGWAVSDAGFDILVLCAKERQKGKYEGVAVYYCSLNDDDEEHPLLDSEWRRARAMAHVVAAAVEHGKNVLVTCYQGRNRSGLVTALSLHLLRGWPGDRCVLEVRARRAGALENDSFVENLKALPEARKTRRARS